MLADTGAMKHVLYILLLSFLLNSCGKNFLKLDTENQETEQKDYTFSPNELIIWPKEAMPLKVKISQEFSQAEEEVIISMAQNWETSINLQSKLFSFDQDHLTQKKYYDIESYRDNELGIYPINQWFGEISDSTLGLTQFFGYRVNKGQTNEHIELIHADIFINTDNHQFSTDITNNWASYDLGAVVLHEFGHFLGMPHSKDKPTIMGEHLSYLENPRIPTDLDRLKLLKNYEFMVKEYQNKKYRNKKNIKKEFIHGLIMLHK